MSTQRTLPLRKIFGCGFVAVLLLTILGLAGVGAITLLRRGSSAAQQAAPRIERGIVLPPGFQINIFAEPDNLEVPTGLTFGPDGKLYVTNQSGHIVRVSDTNGDGRADRTEVLFDNPNNQLQHLVGLTFYEGQMFISYLGTIATIEDADGDGKLETIKPIVENLPALLFPDHSNNQIVFGPDGKLYVGVGASTDHGPLQVEYEASVLRMNPDGSELEVFATGFRNPYDLAFSPDGALFATENNPSVLDRTMRYLPVEELNHVQQGKDYGFPRIYGKAPPGDPSQSPVSELYASVGSAGLVYYAADAFPPEWRNGVYIAQWGTGANAALDRVIQNGQSVVFTPLERLPDGSYRGDWKEFLFFDLADNQRPVDVTVGPDGALYVLEFQRTTIYRITYSEAFANIPPTPTPTLEPLPSFPPEVVSAGEALFTKGKEAIPACITCHMLPEQQALGPTLYSLRERFAGYGLRQSLADYIHQSILNPNDFISPGYNANYMFQLYKDNLTEEEVNALVAYVISLQKP